MGESGSSSYLKSGNWANRMKSFHGLRKRNKPLVEKKRRARINESLAQLKALVIESMQKNAPQSYSKLEKADILEMTVKHLKQLKQLMNDREMASKYHVGYNECASEVVRYLGQAHGGGTEMRSRVLDHLSNRMPSGSFTKSQPPSESPIPPSPEIALRLGNSYENTLQNRTDSFSSYGDDSTQSPHSLANEHHGDFDEGCVDYAADRHNRNAMFSTSRVGGMLFSNATATRSSYRTEASCDQTPDHGKLGHSKTTRYHGTPLADLAPKNVHNRMPFSVDVNSTYAPTYSSSTKGSLPPFQIFTQPFQQVEPLNDSKCYTGKSAMASSQSNFKQAHARSSQVRCEVTATECSYIDTYDRQSPVSPNFMANGVLDVNQAHVWRPW